MNKPEHIEQWAWDKAGETFYGRHARGFILWPIIGEFDAKIPLIAAALMGARAEEREACAKIADVWADTKPKSGPHAAMIATMISSASGTIAQAIRERKDT